MFGEGDRLVLLHNPRCSKSRAAHALLEEHGEAFDTRLYLEVPLSRDELEELQRRLGRSPHEWVRRGEDAYAGAGLDDASEAAAVLDAIASHPILMERPIAIRADRAVVGRPPESVLSLVES
jgi:arsenate reductase